MLTAKPRFVMSSVGILSVGMRAAMLREDLPGILHAAKKPSLQIAT
jgi:hypothetical protein